jgi:hypothetical protein
MNTFIPKRMLLLGGLALLLFGSLIARWIGEWGLVTVHVKNAPLGKIIASISRQGHVQVETSMDLTKPVSLDVDRVPVAKAIDILAIRTDSSWRLIYLAAPTKLDLGAAVLSMKSGGKVDDWTTYDYHIPFDAVDSEVVIDPRYSKLTLEGPDQSLSLLLNQAAQKGGVVTAFPKDWLPTVSRIPDSNQVRKIIPGLVSAAHGKSEEFFFLADRDHQSHDKPVAEDQPQLPMNPEWIEQRALAQIDLLPPEKKAEAKKDLAERKALFADMQKLSPEERRSKWKELMANPDFIDKMANYRLMRDANMTADQRISRAQNYIVRKTAMKGQ